MRLSLQMHGVRLVELERIELSSSQSIDEPSTCLVTSQISDRRRSGNTRTTDLASSWIRPAVRRHAYWTSLKLW